MVLAFSLPLYWSRTAVHCVSYDCHLKWILAKPLKLASVFGLVLLPTSPLQSIRGIALLNRMRWAILRLSLDPVTMVHPCYLDKTSFLRPLTLAQSNRPSPALPSLSLLSPTQASVTHGFFERLHVLIPVPCWRPPGSFPPPAYLYSIL